MRKSNTIKNLKIQMYMAYLHVHKCIGSCSSLRNKQPKTVKFIFIVLVAFDTCWEWENPLYTFALHIFDNGSYIIDGPSHLKTSLQVSEKIAMKIAHDK